jgi:hypothetical protein
VVVHSGEEQLSESVDKVWYELQRRSLIK